MLYSLWFREDIVHYEMWPKLPVSSISARIEGDDNVAFATEEQKEPRALTIAASLACKLRKSFPLEVPAREKQKKELK